MELSSEQLDWIVREVVRRLRQMPAVPAAVSAELSLTDRVVTAALLQDQLKGVATLRVDQRAVVTPSARDLLKERGIELVRSA